MTENCVICGKPVLTFQEQIEIATAVAEDTAEAMESGRRSAASATEDASSPLLGVAAADSANTSRTPTRGNAQLTLGKRFCDWVQRNGLYVRTTGGNDDLKVELYCKKHGVWFESTKYFLEYAAQALHRQNTTMPGGGNVEIPLRTPAAINSSVAAAPTVAGGLLAGAPSVATGDDGSEYESAEEGDAPVPPAAAGAARASAASVTTPASEIPLYPTSFDDGTRQFSQDGQLLYNFLTTNSVGTSFDEQRKQLAKNLKQNPMYIILVLLSKTFRQLHNEAYKPNTSYSARAQIRGRFAKAIDDIYTERRDMLRSLAIIINTNNSIEVDQHTLDDKKYMELLAERSQLLRDAYDLKKEAIVNVMCEQDHTFYGILPTPKQRTEINHRIIAACAVCFLIFTIIYNALTGKFPWGGKGLPIGPPPPPAPPTPPSNHTTPAPHPGPPTPPPTIDPCIAEALGACANNTYTVFIEHLNASIQRGNTTVGAYNDLCGQKASDAWSWLLGCFPDDTVLVGYVSQRSTPLEKIISHIEEHMGMEMLGTFISAFVAATRRHSTSVYRGVTRALGW